MQQASQFLKDPKEEIRQAVYEKMVERRRQDIDALNNLYTDLIENVIN